MYINKQTNDNLPRRVGCWKQPVFVRVCRAGYEITANPNSVCLNLKIFLNKGYLLGLAVIRPPGFPFTEKAAGSWSGPVETRRSSSAELSVSRPRILRGRKMVPPKNRKEQSYLKKRAKIRNENNKMHTNV